VFSITPEKGKPLILPFFNFVTVVAMPSIAETELNAGEPLQTFPYPTIPNWFPISKAFMTKWCSQTLLFESMTNKQTKNIELFRHVAVRDIRSPPNLAW